MKIIAFAGSNSGVSINKKLVTYAASLFENADVEILDLNDYEVPMYKHERELESGVPVQMVAFAEKFDSADLAEHNGSYSVAFKNVFDWISRIPSRSAFNEIPMFLMATAGSARGGLGVLEGAVARFPFNGGNVVETFTLPFFNDNFNVDENKIRNAEKDAELKEKVAKISKLEALINE